MKLPAACRSAVEAPLVEDAACGAVRCGAAEMIGLRQPAGVAGWRRRVGYAVISLDTSSRQGGTAGNFILLARIYSEFRGVSCPLCVTYSTRRPLYPKKVYILSGHNFP